MARSTRKVSTLVRSEFTVYDSSNNPVTGLVNGDFTKRLAKDGANDATAVTVAEVANGRYEASFTPASTGFWYLLVSQATHNPRGWDEEFDVTTDGLPAVSDITSAILVLSIETGLTFKDCLRLCTAAAAGKLSGAATTTIVIRNAAADDKDRITATVDASGNRSAITLDLT